MKAYVSDNILSIKRSIEDLLSVTSGTEPLLVPNKSSEPREIHGLSYWTDDMLWWIGVASD